MKRLNQASSVQAILPGAGINNQTELVIIIIMTLGHQQLHNILVPVSSGDINNKLFIVSINDEEEEFEDDDDPDYSPESDEGYRTTSPLANSSCSPGSAHHRDSVIEEALITGTVGEATEDEHGNLMWLVDFKLDCITDIDKEDDNKNVEEQSEEPQQKKQKVDVNHEVMSDHQHEVVSVQEVETVPLVTHHHHHGQYPNIIAPVYSSAPVHYPHHLSHLAPHHTSVSAAKPNYTYTDLITLALRDKTALTVSGIYQWIR